ncbi:MAG: hypothetical protein ACK40X_02805, partial [Armatimonadota bacterium]
SAVSSLCTNSRSSSVSVIVSNGVRSPISFTHCQRETLMVCKNFRLESAEPSNPTSLFVKMAMGFA